MAGSRLIGCGAIFALAGVAASGALFVPGVPPPLPIFLAVAVFFVVLFIGSRAMIWLYPAPALLLAREQAARMKDAPVAAASEAREGSYLRVRGTLEALDETLAAPLTQRPCLAYRFVRVGLGPVNKPGGGSIRERQRGVRARLSDPSGSILVELDGVAPTEIGDAVADAIVGQAHAAMGEAFAALPASIEFPPPHQAKLSSDGARGPWPAALGAPDHERLAGIEREHWPNADVTSRRTLEEHLILPGDRVEIVGYVERAGGVLVLTGPKNGAMQVRPS